MQYCNTRFNFTVSRLNVKKLPCTKIMIIIKTRILQLSAYALAIFIEYTACAPMRKYANDVLNMRIDKNRTHG